MQLRHNFEYFRHMPCCLSCDIWLFGQTCKFVHAPTPTEHTHPHNHITYTKPLLNTHTRTLARIISAVLSWGSRPGWSPQRSGDRGRKSLSRPQAPPSAPCLGSGSGEADATQAPSVVWFCGQSVAFNALGTGFWTRQSILSMCLCVNVGVFAGHTADGGKGF